MSYIYDIKIAIIFFPLLAFIITLPYLFIQYRKYGSISFLRTIIIYSFIFYLLSMFFLVIFPLPDNTESINAIRRVNLKPFTFIMDFIKHNPLILSDTSTYLSAIKHSTFYIPIFNILMFMPLGMYLRYYYKCSFKKTFLIGLLISLFFEITQYTGLFFIYDFPYRLCDIDDLIQNTIGAVLGYFIIKPFFKILPSRDKIDNKSYIKGKKVSDLRYMFAYLIDLIIVALISVSIFKNISYIIRFLSIFILYFSILPQIKGKTIGSFLLRFKIDFEKYKRFKIILRSILMSIYYFGIYLLFLYIIRILGNRFDTKIYVVSLIIIIFNNLLIMGIITLLNQKYLYDRILKTNYVSTIKIKDENEEKEETSENKE